MLSYKNIDETELSALSAELLLDREGEEYLTDILDSFRQVAAEGVDVAICHCQGCLNVRIIDGESCMFVFPIPLFDDADVMGAVLNVSEYSRRELVPLTFTDVPRDYISELGRLFSRLNASVYDDDEDSFFVAVESECSALEELPSITVDDITLDEIQDEDKHIYARLCSDRELNKWWGYDVSEDNPSLDEDYYLAVARGEFRSGVAVTLAIRHGREFLGEAVIYDFDYRGSAAIGIRILREKQGGGVGSRALRALIELCRSLGLKELRTSIMEENEASVRMTKKYMQLVKSENGRADFVLPL
ncbi:MAG: GNAT family N-acetyltransferase [Clostridia bacterium]|nr:GNAT family N-acetyltransferase [Clostridia bacterium]